MESTGIVFSNKEDSNKLKVSRFTEDTLVLISEVELFDLKADEFTAAAKALAKKLGVRLSVHLIHAGSPMDAVQSFWLDRKLEKIAKEGDFDLEALLNEEGSQYEPLKGEVWCDNDSAEKIEEGNSSWNEATRAGFYRSNK